MSGKNNVSGSKDLGLLGVWFIVFTLY